MTLSSTWLGVIQTIRTARPVDLDSLLAPPTPNPGTARSGFPGAAASMPPSAKLWHQTDPDIAHIGIRVLHPMADCAPIAYRLAAAAVERHVVPIMLTTLPASGFERFGFRTERLFGATPEDLAACEAELSRFWSLAIVINVEDVAMLG